MLLHSSPIAEVREEFAARSRRVREIEVRKVAGSAMVPCGLGMGFTAAAVAEAAVVDVVTKVREEEALAVARAAVMIRGNIVDCAICNREVERAKMKG